MMCKLSVALLAVTFGSPIVLAQDKLAAPKGPPPRFITLRSVNQATEEVIFDVQIVQQNVHDQPTMLVYPGGYERLTLGTTPSYASSANGFKVSLKQAKWRGIDDKEVGAGAVAKQLTPGVVVLLSADGATVDTAYRRLFREDTLVLILPAHELPIPYMPHIGGGITVKNVGGR